MGEKWWDQPKIQALRGISVVGPSVVGSSVVGSSVVGPIHPIVGASRVTQQPSEGQRQQQYRRGL